MSSAFQGLVDANGRLNAGVGPAVSYFRGLPLNASGQLVVGAGPIARTQEGIPFNAAGEVVGLQTTQASYYAPGATPCGPNGELCGAALAAIDHFYQGVPYNANGIYVTNGGGGGLPSIVADNFNIVPAVISSTSVGFRAAPAAGSLTPTAYAGGTIILVQATDADLLRVQNTGSVQFAGISGNLTMQLPAYVGPNRLLLPWNSVSGWYETFEPGIYNYLLPLVGTGLTMRLSAAPAGAA